MIEPATHTVHPESGLLGFGQELQLDLGGCDSRIINSRDELAIYTALLAEHIGMTLYQGPIVDYFGEGVLAGITVYQRITTSNITLHAVPADNSAFINVFSCRGFDPDAASAFTVDYFGARACEATTRQRRAPSWEEAGHAS